jgi:FixH
MKTTGRFWPCLIVSMLGANMAIVAITYFAAKSGEGAMVTPGYDERALRWDEHKVALDRSRELGWTCDVVVHAGGEAASPGSLELTLKDASGTPIAGRVLEVQCFHSGHPAAAASMMLTTDAAGRAASPLRTEHVGRYSVRIASRGTATQPQFMLETEVTSLPL